jgi:hypothetical protein
VSSFWRFATLEWTENSKGRQVCKKKLFRKERATRIYESPAMAGNTTYLLLQQQNHQSTVEIRTNNLCNLIEQRRHLLKLSEIRIEERIHTSISNKLPFCL